MSNPIVVLSIDDISILDKQIDVLTEFKPIPEHEVKLLCDKVSSPTQTTPIIRLGQGNSHY